MELPQHLQYGQDHVWVAQEGEQVRVGLTHHAQQQLGETIFIEFITPIPGDAPIGRLVEIGTDLEVGQVFVAVECTWKSRDIRTPIAGQVTAVNEDLVDDPGAIDRDPYGTWLVTLVPKDVAGETALLTPEAYAASVAAN